jgi:hypothetical protein
MAAACCPAAPAQLPVGIADFTGRQAQTACLYSALASHEVASNPGAVRVAVVAGVAGLGKTALALHVAHRVRHLFPDGQLYVHLSGASSHPAVPGELLARFLRDLGVDGDKIPAGGDERAALYRTLLAGRHRADPSRAFRLLGLWEGQWISLPAAAALTGEREEDVAGALEALVDASLLESPEPDCYQLQDLLPVADTGQDARTPRG